MERLTTTPEEVSEDIDINTKEGLQAFSRYTEDTYTEIIEHAKENSNESTHATLENASRLYESLKEKLDNAFSLKDEGAHVDETLANELQDSYNQLLDILDGFVTEEVPDVVPEEENAVAIITEDSPVGESVAVKEIEIVPVVEEITTEEPVPIKNTPIISVIQEETATIETLPVVAEEDVSQESEPVESETKVENPEVAEITSVELKEKGLVVDEGKEIENSTLVVLKEKTESLIERAEDLLEKYQEITEVASPDAVLNVGQHYYKQLGATAERARTTLKNILSHIDKEDKVTELAVEHLDDTIDEISDNLDQLNKGLGGFFEKDEEVSLLDTKKTANGSIELAQTEEIEEKVVPITLVKKPEPIVSKKSPSTAIHNAPIRPSTERVEKAFKTEWGNMIEKVLTVPRYKNFVSYTFPSPVQFEAMLRREIQRIEAPSKFDSAFGFAYKSAFHDLLRNMTVKEVVDFDSQPRDDIRAELQERDIKYEVYLDWIDSLNTMLSITHAHPTITFGELFIRAELETLLQHDEAMAA